MCVRRSTNGQQHLARHTGVQRVRNSWCKRKDFTRAERVINIADGHGQLSTENVNHDLTVSFMLFHRSVTLEDEENE